MIVSPETMRRWKWSGRVPTRDTIGMYEFWHPKYRGYRDIPTGPDARINVLDKAFERLNPYYRRVKAIREYGFAIPCAEALDAITKLSPLVEVGAGTGYWSAVLKKRGADIVATDIGRSYYSFSRPGRHHPVLRNDAVSAIRRFPERNVLMVWPCYNMEWATDAAKALAPGQSLALISEGSGGCVGADSLFRYLEKRFDETASIDIPVWEGIHDRLTIHRKRAASRSSF